MFNQTALHYRRQHAPNVRYLPSDVNVTIMYTDYCEKQQDSPDTLDFYRQQI